MCSRELGLNLGPTAGIQAWLHILRNLAHLEFLCTRSPRTESTPGQGTDRSAGFDPNDGMGWSRDSKCHGGRYINPPRWNKGDRTPSKCGFTEPFPCGDTGHTVGNTKERGPFSFPGQLVIDFGAWESIRKQVYLMAPTSCRYKHGW